jgi:hypothetical protein
VTVPRDAVQEVAHNVMAIDQTIDVNTDFVTDRDVITKRRVVTFV